MFKTNDNSERLNYGDLLLPPEGYVLDYAIGTTYSLDLEALTAVCFSLGLSEETEDYSSDDKVRMLNLLQKTSKKIILFCEAGQIKKTSNQDLLFLLLEKMIIPVALPKRKKAGEYPSFHPKTWLLQYKNKKGEYKYRFVVMSRNLTFDRSWDVGIAINGTKSEEKGNSKQIIGFLDFLCDKIDSSEGKEAKEKRGVIRKICKSLNDVHFSADRKEFGDDFSIMPLGIGEKAYDMNKDPLFCQDKHSADYSFNELVVFSPFVSGNLIEQWNKEDHSLKSGTIRTLITRKTALSDFTKEQSNLFKIYALKDKIVDGENSISDKDFVRQRQDIHAKIYLRKKYDNVDLYLGSMNATYSAINKNVEMVIRLRTKNKHLNTKIFLNDLFCGAEEDAQNPFEIVYPEEKLDAKETKITDTLEQIIKEICRFDMNATVSSNNGKYDVLLEIKGKNIPKDGVTITPFRTEMSMPLDKKMTFSNLEILQLSEFYSICATKDDVSVERIIMIPTIGIPIERETEVVNNIVKDKETFLEYVAFMLGENYITSRHEVKNPLGTGSFEGTLASMPALYETMLKKAWSEPEKFGEIGQFLQMISSKDIIPEEFSQLFSTFKNALKIK